LSSTGNLQIVEIPSLTWAIILQSSTGNLQIEEIPRKIIETRYRLRKFQEKIIKTPLDPHNFMRPISQCLHHEVHLNQTKRKTPHNHEVQME
jgi:hypothetical protein